MRITGASLMLICMLYAHILDDYVLQGILASMKQRKWWQDQLDKETGGTADLDETIYRHDHLVALFMHAACWSFSIMIPPMLAFNAKPASLYAVMWLVNTPVHMLVDHLKCNCRLISLKTDQMIHVMQLVLTCAAAVLGSIY